MGGKISRTAADMGIPPEIGANMPLVRVAGRSRADIENYTGILEYTDSVLRVKARDGEVCVRGSGLVLEEIREDNLTILGKIDMVELK